MLAEGANGLFEVDLPLIEGDLELRFELVGNHAGGDRAVHLAIFAGFDGDDADQFGQALGQFGHGVQLVGFALGATLLEHFQAALVGGGQGNRQALWEQEVAGVAGGDFDLVGFAAQADDVVGEDDFSFSHAGKG